MASMSESFIPYGRHVIDDADIEAVTKVLRGDWLTTGPLVDEFEKTFAAYVGARYAVAVSSGTAALHLCVLSAGITSGDEVIVPALTFAASANCARYAGAAVVFADVDEATLTIDVAHVERLITKRTRAIIAVDYGGLPCELGSLRRLADRHGVLLIEDACHAIGARYCGQPVGSIASLSAFSFHPVKHMTSGEGGMLTTDDADLASRARMLRNHGISTDHREREQRNTWHYDMAELGYNYRLTDIQCALGASQLRKMPLALERRRQIARRYQEELSGGGLVLPRDMPEREHAWHLYAVRVRGEQPAELRQRIYNGMRAARIGVNVHYIPVYWHSYYQKLGYLPGLCPVAEHAYHGLISLPMWHGLADDEQSRVIDTLVGLCRSSRSNR
jgi:perosamine synthetase